MTQNQHQYYRILADPAADDRWQLDEPRTEDGEEIDTREFTCAEPYTGPAPSAVPVEAGIRVEFNLAAFHMPVVPEEVGSALEALAPGDIERFPVSVDSNRFEIINVLRTQECLDEDRSEIERFTEEDGRPEKIGEYLMVTNLTIDVGRTADAHIFRIDGCEIALIVSEQVKTALERISEMGIVFDSVVNR